MAFAYRIVSGMMKKLVGFVFRSSSPLDIAKRVVRLDAIFVSGFMLICWWIAKEC